MPLLSVVIPTYNEAANIGALLLELEQALAGVDAEFVVVDDASPDGTARLAGEASPRARVVVRTGERGLATAVVRGLRESRGTFVAVMDSDFQHPPEAVRRLLDKAEETGADLVLGSRYAAGGSEGGFAWHRRAISWGAATLARAALPPVRAHRLTDPMTGLFLVRRDRVPVEALQPTGYKVLLEIMGRADLRRVEEVGYAFQDRRGGASKLGGAVILQYLWHLAALARTHPENRRAGRFALVGASGVLVNLGLLWLLHGLVGLHDLLAVPLAVEASILSNFLLNDRFTFHDRRRGHALKRLAKFNAVSLFALAVNLAAYLVLRRGLGAHYLLAEAVAIVVAFGTNYLGNLQWTYGDGRPARPKAAGVNWLPFAVLALAATWLYTHDLDGVDEIYFDEHYYLSVARQIDNGVWEDPCWGDHRPVNFEHPPLAKLMIAGSVVLLDTDHHVFDGCRDPNCHEDADGNVPSSCPNKRAYDRFTTRMREDGNPYAWRLPSALLGVAGVTFTALAARRIFRSDAAGLAAGGLLLVDGLYLTSSRIALLDIFPAGFGAVALWCATYPTRRGVVGAGLFLGLAFASKYTALFLGPGVLLVALWSHHRAGKLRRRRFDAALASLLGLPLVVWALSYLPWWVRWSRQGGFVWAAGHLVSITRDAVKWDTVGKVGTPHPNASGPLDWIFVSEAVFYYFQGDVGGERGLNRYIYSVGNPAVWWMAMAAVVGILLWGAWRAGRRWLREFQGAIPAPATLHPLVVAALLPAMAFAGFFFLQRETFLFYMTALLPFLVLPLAGLLAALWGRGALGRTAAALAGLACVAVLLHYWPILVAEPIRSTQADAILDTLPGRPTLAELQEWLRERLAWRPWA